MTQSPRRSSSAPSPRAQAAGSTRQTPNGFRRRRIPWYSSGRPIYRLRSQKTQKTQWCESYLEVCHCYWLEWLRSVKAYQTQPVTLAFRMRQRVLTYSPDTLLSTSRDRLVFREVKPQSRLDKNPALVDKLIAVRAACDARGVGFEVVTEAQIQRPPLGILRSIYHYGHVQPPQQSLVRLKSALAGQECLTLSEAYGICASEQLPAWYVLSWMWHGQITWPPLDTLTPDLALTVHANVLD